MNISHLKPPIKLARTKSKEYLTTAVIRPHVCYARGANTCAKEMRKRNKTSKRGRLVD